MQLRPRCCDGVGQGARSPGVQGVIGRLSAGVYMADWALRAFDPSAYCILGSRTVYEQKRARCNMRGTAHAAFPHGAAQRYERDPPPSRWGRSLVAALHEVGMEGLRLRRLLDLGGKLRRCAWIQ